jgi:hypothetical protein
MPTVLRSGGFRFFFYSQESREPPHIHVESGDATAKFGSIRSRSPGHEDFGRGI